LANIREEIVLDYIRRYNPSTVKELETRLRQGGIRPSEEDLLEVVAELQRNGLISFEQTRYDSFRRFVIGSNEAWKVYSITSVSVVEVLLVVYQAEISFFLGFRILFGLGLLGFLPGYSTVRALFPSDHFPELESILLSIFLSVVVSIGLGVILGVGYFFTGASSVALLSSYTVAVTLLAAYRRYSFQRGSTNVDAPRRN
jgi:Protein of unknown function (DUF1616)